jgi:hypothetical protein
VVDYVFDIPQFRRWYEAFADETAYPDDVLEAYYDFATCYISDEDYGLLNGKCRYRAITLMTAHLLMLSKINPGTGQPVQPQLKTGATVDKVTVTLTPPPLKNEWQWWLTTTPYGAELLALLQSASSGGFVYGGLPEGTAIRKWGGLF